MILSNKNTISNAVIGHPTARDFSDDNSTTSWYFTPRFGRLTPKIDQVLRPQPNFSFPNSAKRFHFPFPQRQD